VAQPSDHRGIVETAEKGGNHQNLRLGESQHEREFAIAKNHHQRVADRSRLQAGQVQNSEFPPVRQLERHRVPGNDAACSQIAGHAVGQAVDLLIAEPNLLALPPAGPSERIATIAVLSGVFATARAR
jgi:hypothetical protein